MRVDVNFKYKFNSAIMETNKQRENVLQCVAIVNM